MRQPKRFRLYPRTMCSADSADQLFADADLYIELREKIFTAVSFGGHGHRYWTGRDDF